MTRASGSPKTAPATLAERDDATADLDENVGTTRAVMWVLDAALLAWLVAQVVWFGRQIRRRRTSLDPPKGPRQRQAANGLPILAP